MDEKLSRVNPSGKLAPASQARVDGKVLRTSTNFNRATILPGDPKGPNEIGQRKMDQEEVDYRGNADSTKFRGTPMRKEK